MSETEKIINLKSIISHIDNFETKVELLVNYAHAIFETNKKFNLTGYKTVEDVISGLIIDSIVPMKSLNVPRGTSFIDIGTGSGVPGVVLGILYPHITGVLVDSTAKKIDFINETCCKLEINNIKAVSIRAEEFSSKQENKKRFGFCVTKAFGPLYYSAEFAGPVLKEGGFLYIYSHLQNKILSAQLKGHFSALGFNDAANEKRDKYCVADCGLMWIKERETPAKYPRRFTIIKKEAEKVPETCN